MSTKKHISKILLSFLALPVFLFCSCTKNKTSDFTVGFYKISTSTTKKLESALQEIYKDNSSQIAFAYIENEKQLKELVRSKSVHLVFTNDGLDQKNCAEVANKKALISNEIDAELTNSIRQKIIYENNNVISAPILSDNFEIDINFADFRNSKVEAINNWDDVEQFLNKMASKNKNPLYFAGEDSIYFFDMLGALCESIDGLSYYEKSLEILNKGGKPQDIANNLIGSSTSPMVNTGILLKRYIRNGYISPDCFNYSCKDMEKFAKEDYAKMMIMPLSYHRTFEYDAIRRYSSAYIPSKKSASARCFTANTIYAIPVNKHSEVSILLSKLYEDENQSILSRYTGLAPVTRNSRTPDKQANDARYWIAATNSPLAGLGHSTKLSKQDLDNIKDCIKNILVYE